MSGQGTSALVVLVPEAEPLVGDFRRRFDVSASFGLGPHVTVIFPFREAGTISVAVRAELRALCARQPRFDFSLARIERFPSAVYLDPEPRGPFDALTRAVALAFPGCPPYGGAFADPTPHLTIAQRPPAEDLGDVERRIRARLEGALPLCCSAREVSLVVKEGECWTVADRFKLG